MTVSELLDFEHEPDVACYDALTEKIISRVLYMSEGEKKQLMCIIRAFENWEVEK